MKLINIIKTNPLADRMKKLAFPVTALAVAAIFTTVCCQAADPVDLPQSLLEGDASGYVTSLYPNIGPKIKLIHISKGMYTGKYKLGEDFYPFMGKIVDGKLKGTVTLSDDDTLDFTLELDDRGVVHYLDDFPEGAREIRFNSEIEKRLLPLRWKAANESHSPYQKQRHFTIPLPGEILMTMNWIPGDGKNIPDHWTCINATTVSQWRALMEGIIDGNTKPVDIRDRKQVMAFLAKLTERERAAGRLPEGYVYRLPTEAEWEYACRAGTTGDYNVDGAKLDELGWFWNNSGDHRDNAHNNAVQPVCLKRPNAWGLYDMHGNCWEYVQENNVFRGGSFFSYDKDCTSSSKTSMGGCPFCGGGSFARDQHSHDFLQRCGDYHNNQGFYYDHAMCRTCLGFRIVLAVAK